MKGKVSGAGVCVCVCPQHQPVWTVPQHVLPAEGPRLLSKCLHSPLGTGTPGVSGESGGDI